MSDTLPALTPAAPGDAAPDTSLVPAGPPDLPALADPAREPRWTGERQAEFLRELAASHNVTLAARAVGMSRQSAYRLRARLQGQPFDRAWTMAFGTAFDALAEAAMERALNGVEVPHFHKGELVGTSRRFDERLTLGLLSRRGALTPLPPVPSTSTVPRGLEAAIERVAKGPEHWAGERRGRRGW